MKRKIVILLLGGLLSIALCGCAAINSREESTSQEIQTATEEADAEETAAADTDSAAQEAKEGDSGEAEEVVQSDLSVIPADPGAPRLDFNTVDVNGNPVDLSIIEGARLVMVNFWEPWCGPCVGEMPDLEKLYEAYRDQGLVIIGAYSTTDMQEDVEAILSDCGTTYPIIVSDESMYQFMTEYVPTTVFFNGDGYIISKEPVIGSNSLENWSRIVEEFLNS